MKLLLTTILLTILSVSSIDLHGQCSFKPDVAYYIEANTNIVLAYEVQVMRKKESPNTVRLSKGLRAIYEPCTESWMIRDMNIYYDARQAIHAQNKWIDEGYVGSFVMPTYIYVEVKDNSSNKPFRSDISEDIVEQVDTIPLANKVPQNSSIELREDSTAIHPSANVDIPTESTNIYRKDYDNTYSSVNEDEDEDDYRNSDEEGNDKKGGRNAPNAVRRVHYWLPVNRA